MKPLLSKGNRRYAPKFDRAGLRLGILLCLCLVCGCRTGKMMPERKNPILRGKHGSTALYRLVAGQPASMAPQPSSSAAQLRHLSAGTGEQQENQQTAFQSLTESQEENSTAKQTAGEADHVLEEEVDDRSAGTGEPDDEGLPEGGVQELLPMEEGEAGYCGTEVGTYEDLKEQPNQFSLNELIQLALQHNPQVEMVRRELDKACARIPQAGSLDDPLVAVQAWPIYPNVPQTAAGRMTTDISISQSVPWRGKRAARVAEVSREVSGWQNRLLAIELKIANEVKLAYFSLALARERQEITEQELNFLDQLYQRAEVLYETGKVGQQDLLRLKAERGMAQAERARWDQDEIEATADLIRLLQFDQKEPIEINSKLPVELTLSHPLDESLQRASEASPELMALWADLQRDQWKVQQARLEYYPDLTFRVGWGGMTTQRAIAPFADGIDTINTGVSFNLPVRKATRHASLRESESQAVQTLKQWELEKDDIARDVRQIHAQLDSQQTRLKLLEQTVIPRFMEAIEISLVAYESNQTDLTELINLRRELLKFKLIEKELRSQWHIAKANLVLLIAEIDWKNCLD